MLGRKALSASTSAAAGCMMEKLRACCASQHRHTGGHDTQVTNGEIHAVVAVITAGAALEIRRTGSGIGIAVICDPAGRAGLALQWQTHRKRRRGIDSLCAGHAGQEQPQ